MLEALVLDSGTWEDVSPTRKRTMSRDGSMAILLWAEKCARYSPLPHHKLPTALGVQRLTLEVPPPSEFKYCWCLQAILRRMGKGKTADTRQEFEEYRENFFLTLNPGSTYCWLPDIWSMEPEGLDTAGMSLSPRQFVDVYIHAYT